MRKAYDCIVACILALEIDAGVNLSDGDIYWSFGIREIGIRKDHNLVSNSHSKIEEKLIEELGVPVLYRSDIASNFSVKEYLISKIRDEKMILMLDSKYLKYRNLFLNNPGVYHYIWPKEYSVHDGKVYIVDLYIPNDDSNTVECWVEIDELIRAWDEVHNRHFIWEKSYYRYDLLTKNNAEVVKDTIRYYLNSRNSLGICTDSKREGLSGIEAVYFWVNGLTGKEDLDSLLAQIKTGGFLTIKFYLLQHFIEKSISNEFVSSYKKIIDDWDNLCRMLYIMRLRRKADFFEGFKKEAIKLLDKEQKLLKCISEVI